MYASLSDYLTCAAWSSTDDDGEPLDAYSFSKDAEKRMSASLEDFVILVNQEIPDLEMDAGQFAHDFWLTRNGHGTGFWDRGLGELGDKLTELAKSFGSADLWLNPETLEIELD